jgi:hypothetical protein
MRELVVTAKFKRSVKKFVQRNMVLQRQIEKTLSKMAEDVFMPSQYYSVKPPSPQIWGSDSVKSPSIGGFRGQINNKLIL